jgi:hypothetical protein
MSWEEEEMGCGGEEFAAGEVAVSWGGGGGKPKDYRK